MSYNTDIIILGSELSEGQSLRATCPACQGGTTNELSLSITRNEGIVWQCFRSKCGIKGSTNGVSFGKGIETKPERITWEGTTHELPEKVAQRVQELWGLHNPEGWYWTTDFGGRVAMSVWSPSGSQRGWVLRSLGGGGTKALTYGEGPSWYIKHTAGPTYIVEDIPSAVRVSLYANAVALLGTRISLENAVEIGTYSTRPTTIALDQDATSTAFRHAKRYNLLLNTPHIMPLQRDFKNMSEEELIRTLNHERETCTRQ